MLKIEIKVVSADPNNQKALQKVILQSVVATVQQMFSSKHSEAKLHGCSLINSVLGDDDQKAAVYISTPSVQSVE